MLICIIIIILSFFNVYLLDLAVVVLLVAFVSSLLISYYLYFKKEENAKFILRGWTFAVCGWLMLGTHGIGIYSIINDYKYFYEFAMFVEAIFFSIALSSKLNQTKALQNQVNLNEVLTQELHHRVKNNMQFIISLYRLKLNENITKEISDKLKDVENSIKAMSNIHEILYDRSDLKNINTNEYFTTLLQEIKNTYKEKNVSISLNCKVTLDIDKAIYCGIILNELVTNSFKYAFINNEKGSIEISFEKTNDTNILSFKDDGIGFDNKNISKGFGMELVKSLVQNELKGSFEIESLNGTFYKFIF